MSDPFIGQIQPFGFNFPPAGWAQCDGQLLPIAQNTALFSLLGTIYGGDGETTFGLPDLRGRVPMHQGNGPGLTPRGLGQKTGQERVTLSQNEMPSHSHVVRCNQSAGNARSPVNGFHATSSTGDRNYAPTSDANMGSTLNTGSSQSHENMPPVLAINWCIALQGIFPSQN